MDNHNAITRVLVWVVVGSMILYFVLSPIAFIRPTPKTTSPTLDQVIPTSTPYGASEEEGIPAQPQVVFPEFNTSTDLNQEIQDAEPTQ